VLKYIQAYCHNASLAEEMMAPESQYTTSGRANPSGIPFLYLSENEKTVVLKISFA
jgi:RES domain-containing protein